MQNQVGVLGGRGVLALPRVLEEIEPELEFVWITDSAAEQNLIVKTVTMFLVQVSDVV